jgi:hypothetical protein
MLLAETVGKIATAVADAAHAHDLGPEVPVVALGGAGAALAPEVAHRLGRPCVQPEHAGILSSIGAALSLVRAEVVRHGGRPEGALGLAREAERACVDAGAAPQTVRVETAFEARGGLLRAVATGAVALERGAAGREPVDASAQLRAAATALGMPEDGLGEVARNDFYGVFCENGAGAVAVVDGLGTVALAERSKRVLCGDREELVERLRDAVEEHTVNLGVAALLPRVAVVSGARIVDLSDARRAEDLVAGARAALAEDSGTAVAVVLA